VRVPVLVWVLVIGVVVPSTHVLTFWSREVVGMLLIYLLPVDMIIVLVITVLVTTLLRVVLVVASSSTAFVVVSALSSLFPLVFMPVVLL
jgi:hypothetical protein